MATKKAPAKKSAVKTSPAVNASRRQGPQKPAGQPIASPAPVVADPRRSDTLLPLEAHQDDDDKGGIDSVRHSDPLLPLENEQDDDDGKGGIDSVR